MSMTDAVPPSPCGRGPGGGDGSLGAQRRSHPSPQPPPARGGGEVDIGPLEAIPPLRARTVRLGDLTIAVFRSSDDRVFALHDRCPHKGGPLSQGIVHGHSVTCPLHGWVIDLASGEARAPDEGCTRRVAARVVDGRILLGDTA